jgi:hypothetical protein
MAINLRQVIGAWRVTSSAGVSTSGVETGTVSSAFLPFSLTAALLFRLRKEAILACAGALQLLWRGGFILQGLAIALRKARFVFHFRCRWDERGEAAVRRRLGLRSNAWENPICEICEGTPVNDASRPRGTRAKLVVDVRDERLPISEGNVRSNLFAHACTASPLPSLYLWRFMTNLSAVGGGAGISSMIFEECDNRGWRHAVGNVQQHQLDSLKTEKDFA